ncbi:MAG: hypothetical protein IKQ41_06910 [Clostridia bacterium]|nr:hypothetical protein [Clostridia bacterium]
MKRICALLAAALLLCCVLPAMAGETWYCPVCGRLNDNNFCPVDGTARPADIQETTVENYTYTYAEPMMNFYTEYAYVTGTLNAKLATRTGPGTLYDEPGSFLSAGSRVTVLSKAYDQRNGIWWVQVDFTESGAHYRAYTGVKRFNGLNLNLIPEDQVIGSCAVRQSLTGYYGPGYGYRAIGKKVPAGIQCEIYGYATDGDNDFIQIEFYDQSQNRSRRAWIPISYAEDLVMYSGYYSY